MKPLIVESRLTKPSRWYVLTRYAFKPSLVAANGNIVVASRKYDVTDQMERILREHVPTRRRKAEGGGR